MNKQKNTPKDISFLQYLNFVIFLVVILSGSHSIQNFVEELKFGFVLNKIRSKIMKEFVSDVGARRTILNENNFISLFLIQKHYEKSVEQKM